MRLSWLSWPRLARAAFEPLAKRFSVSRVPAREALRPLETEGLITPEPNKGACVSSRSLDEIEEMLDIRIGLELRALKLALPAITPAVAVRRPQTRAKWRETGSQTVRAQSIVAQIKVRTVAAAIACTAGAAPMLPGALAQELGGTLAKIQETGAIGLGHRDVSVPFSFLDDKQKPVGFAMDLCDKVVDAVKVRLGRSTLNVKLQPIQLSNQIPLIQNGTIDIVCGPATNTLERQKVVTFSNTIFVSSIRAVVRKDSPIMTFEDMAGKSISLTAASTSIGLLTAREQQKHFQTTKALNPDHGASFLALATGRTEAFVMDDILLAGLVANHAKPGDWRIIDDALRVEPYGLIMRKDDPQFKALVDETLAALVKSGEFETLYRKWFMSPIPPKGINLNFPMTAPLKKALATPNDTGV